MNATLVIPTYNRAERLRSLLDCLTRQATHRLARVVVGDDGSSDHTAEVVQSFADRLPIVHAYQEDLGFRAGQARNLGIERAIGDVVIFADDDVLVGPDYVEAHLSLHEARRGERMVVLGPRHRTLAFDGATPGPADFARAERDDRIADLEGRSVDTHEAPWIFVYSCNFSVTRGGPELRFDDGFSGWGLEDTELGYRLHHAGYRIVEEPRAQVLHVDDDAPRDPFRCEARQLPPSYDTYVENAVRFMDLYPADPVLARFIRQDLRWYVRDAHGRWVKNGYENDVEHVIAECRQRRTRAAGAGDDRTAERTLDRTLDRTLERTVESP
ncbi:MAG: glycosyltransferase [Sandaracinaceae bacterium]|nr:glycosyltransferase [Sandaracinaceae bacterium]